MKPSRSVAFRSPGLLLGMPLGIPLGVPQNLSSPRAFHAARGVAVNACRVKGFTLVEAVTVMLIIGILATFAVPAYQDMIRRGQITSAAMDLATAVRQTRAEAIRRATEIYLVRNDTNWQIRTSNSYDASNGDGTLQVFQLGKNIDATFIVPTGASSVTFMARGNLGSSATKIKLTHKENPTAIVRCVDIDRTGNITLARDAEADSHCTVTPSPSP